MADQIVTSGSSTVLNAGDVAYINGFAGSFKVKVKDGVITLTSKTNKTVTYEFSATAGAKLAFLNGAATISSTGKISLAVKGLDAAVNSKESFITAAPAAFTLTAGVDAWNGTNASETILAGDLQTAAGAVATFTVGDEINGGKGTDTLKWIQTANIAAIPVGATLTSVENLNVTSGGTVALNTTGTNITGLTGLTVRAIDQVQLTAAATQSVTATVTNAGGATASTVNGGSTVAVTSTNNIGDNITIGGTTAAAGAVTVTSTGGATAADVAGTITVTGGTTVTVNQNAGNAAVTGQATTGGVVTVTGNASTTAVTVDQTNTAAGFTAVAATADAPAIAGVVGYTAGQVVIADVNAANALADTITTVTLGGYGPDAVNAVSTVNSGALTTLNLSKTGAGAASGLTVNGNVAAANQTPTALALNLSRFTEAGTVTLNNYATVNVAGSTGASSIGTLAAGAATALNVSGDQTVTLTAANLAAGLTAITSTNTAGLTIGNAQGANVTYTLGSGADSIVLTDEFTKTVTTGAGNDTVTIVDTDADGVLASVAAGLVGTVNANDGSDTIALTEATSAAVSANAAFNTAFTGFEVLDITEAAGAAGSVTNLAGINGVNQVVTRGIDGGALTINGYSSGGRLTLDGAVGAGGSYVANVANAAVTAGDVFNINLNNAAQTAFGSVTAAGVDTVNITVTDTGVAQTATNAGDTRGATIQTLTLGDGAQTTTINVSGNNGLTITNGGNTAVTTFNASGVVADNGATVDTPANLAVTYVSGNNTAAAVVTITGGAGNDTLTGNAAKDTITGGAGSDILTGAGGADTLVVGTGRDVITIVSDHNNGGAVTNHSTTAANDVINGFVLSSAITAAANLSTHANFIGSTAGGANASLLSLDLDNTGGAAPNAANVANVAAGAVGQAAGVTYSVTNGIITLAGNGAAGVDTLGEWLTEVAAVAANAGDVLGFVFGSDTYVFAQNGNADVLVKLTGIAATSLVETTGGATTATAGALLWLDIV